MPEWIYQLSVAALVISNILFVRTLNREVKSLKSRNEELERTNKASLDLAESRSGDVENHRKMYDPAYFKQYMEIKIKVEVEKAVSNTQADLNDKQIKELGGYIDELLSYVSFVVYHEKKMDRDKRISFVHTYFKEAKNIVWYIMERKIESVEKTLLKSQTLQVEPEKEKIQNQSEIL